MNEKGYKKLIVWQKADELAFAIYKASQDFPKEEIYGITSQLRRAALSVPTNLAEGCGRQNKKESKQFASIALGSLAEVESLLDFSFRLGYLKQEEHKQLMEIREEVGRLLWRFHQSFSLPSVFSSFLSLMPSFLVSCVLCLVSCDLFANNLSITNTTLTSQDTSADTIKVQFDISWNNSWSDASNKDAAWVFIKYSTNGGTTWNHATLKTAGTNPTNFSQGSGTAINIVVPTDKKGALIQRSAQGSGTLTTTSVQFVWDYVADGVSDTNADAAATVIKVLGIEMVYIPQGGFYAGDSTVSSNGELHFGVTSTLPGAVNLPGAVDSEAKISFANNVSTQWYYTTASNSGEAATGSAFEVSAAFPKGYQAFYLMKYEITEGEWVDFFNTLTSDQKTTRDITDSTGKNSDSSVNRNTISWSSGDAATSRTDRAMGYLSWRDLAAYLDWAALRPITELEFEKACRGPLSPVSGEYAWGTTTITAGTVVSGTENGTETITTSSANANYNNTTFSGGDASAGPLRAGIFATSSTVTRGTTGAGYYGNMELTGNVAERVVTLGNGTGRSFAGTHGDGVLTSLASFEGNATNLDWPGISSTISQGVTGATGSGFKGGSWSDTSTPRLTISGRPLAASTDTTRGSGYGGRGARTENS